MSFLPFATPGVVQGGVHGAQELPRLSPAMPLSLSVGTAGPRKGREHRPRPGLALALLWPRVCTCAVCTCLPAPRGQLTPLSFSP